MCFFKKNEIRYNRKAHHYGVLKHKSKKGITSVFMTTKEFSSGKSNRVMHDYYRWFAENTGTTDVLNKLKEDIETCFQLIDEANSKEKTN